MTTLSGLFARGCIAFSLAASAVYGQTGLVRANGVPVPGATVKAGRDGTTLSTVTDEFGHYKLDGVSNGSWTFEVEMFRFQPSRKEVQVSGPFNLEWDLSLQPPGAPLPARAGFARREQGVADAGGPAGPAGGQGPGFARRQGTAAGPGTSARAAAGPAAFGRPGAQGTRAQQALQAQRGAVPELTNQLEGQASAAEPAAAELPSNVQGDSANEAFLLNGTLSRGLQQVGGEPGGDMPGFGLGMGMRPVGAQPDGQEAPGFNQVQGGGPGGPGGGPGGFGGGGFGGRGGGFGGGGFGGPGGGFGGREGFGGPGARQGQPDFRRRNGTDAGLMGNRRNRGQQGLHGMVNVVVHNSALDARPFAVNGQQIVKPSYAQERWNIMIGGPLMIPHLFRRENTTFNFSYTGARADNLASRVGTLPSLDQRAGDFSAFSQVIYDPRNQLPFPGNRIPFDRISPVAIGLLKFFPNPNQIGSCSASAIGACAAQNYQFTTIAPNNNDNIGVRLGQSLGKKDRLALNFQTQSRSAINPQIFGFLDNTDGRGFGVSLNWVHTFAPRIFNVANASFNRNRSNALPYFAYGSDIAAALGIEGTSASPINYGPPNLNFTNYAALSDGSASLTRVQSLTLTDALTWMRGNHNRSFGVMVQRSQNNIQTDSNARGSYNFTGLATSGLDANGQPLPGTGLDFADFLLGFPNSSSIRFGDTSTYFRGTNYSFFGQDDWRMRPNLTINFGLRYEYFAVPSERYGREANLDIAPGFAAVAPVVPGQAGPYSGTFPAALVNSDRNNFAPRGAIAWRPWKEGKTVVRAGYGVYYNGAVYNGFMRNLAAQPPFANTNSVITSPAALLTLVNGFVISPRGKTITNTWAIDRFYRVPYAQTWNFSIQQDLPMRLVLQASYLGTKGTRLDTQRLPNRAAPGSPLTAEERRLIANATGFTFETSDANSIYHSARVSLMRRFARGMSFNADYVFAKSIDDASTFGGGLAQNDRDIRAERSLSNFDRRHVLNARYVFTSPFGHNSKLLAGHATANKFLEDWTLNGGLTAETGTPLNPRVAGNLSDSAGTGASGTTRPNATGLAVTTGGGYFNTAAFVLPLPGFFGNAGRNTIPGPGLVSLNASFGRSFGLGERRNLEFRIDAANALNHVSVVSIGTTVNSSTYGLPLSAAAMRSVSLTARFRF